MARYDEEETELPATGAAVIVGSHLPRLTSKIPEFPFGPSEPDAPRVCYFTIDDSGAIEWVRDHEIELEDALLSATKNIVTVFAVWPGQWRSHLFVVDNPDVALAELKGAAMSSGALKASISKSIRGAAPARTWEDEVAEFTSGLPRAVDDLDDDDDSDD